MSDRIKARVRTGEEDNISLPLAAIKEYVDRSVATAVAPLLAQVEDSNAKINAVNRALVELRSTVFTLYADGRPVRDLIDEVITTIHRCFINLPSTESVDVDPGMEDETLLTEVSTGGSNRIRFGTRIRGPQGNAPREIRMLREGGDINVPESLMRILEATPHSEVLQHVVSDAANRASSAVDENLRHGLEWYAEAARRRLLEADDIMDTLSDSDEIDLEAPTSRRRRR